MAYTVMDYGAMIADQARTGAYFDALAKVVKPGSVVVDVGTGSGILALEACRLGARIVYAIETHPVVELARLAAKANGLADRVVFFRQRSTEVTLPERCDVLVSDLRGSMPLFGEHLPDIIDARDRFLKPGGSQIPQRDVLFALPVEAPEEHARLTKPWEGRFDLAVFRDSAFSSVHVVGGGIFEGALADPKPWATLDYTSMQSTDVKGDVSFDVLRDGTVHGLACFFSAHLLDDVGFDNGPSGQTIVYARYFAPFKTPLDVRIGEQIRAKLVVLHGPTGHLFSWSCRSERQESRQSTAFAYPPRSSTIREG